MLSGTVAESARESYIYLLNICMLAVYLYSLKSVILVYLFANCFQVLVNFKHTETDLLSRSEYHWALVLAKQSLSVSEN